MKSQKKIGLFTSLFVGSLASVATAQTQPVTPPYEKVKDDAQKSRVTDFGITLSPFPKGYSYVPRTETVRQSRLEIDAVVREEWKAGEGENPPTFTWVGALNPLVSAYNHDANGNSYPRFGDAQKYTWTLTKGDSVTLLDPDPTADPQIQLQQAVEPSTAQKQFRLDFGLGSGEDKWKENLTPEKWPKTTTALVGVTGGPNSEVLPAMAKVNWHLPYNTTFKIMAKVEVHIPGTLLNPSGETIDFGTFSEADMMDDLGGDFKDAMVVGALTRGTAVPRLFVGAARTVGYLVLQGAIETAVGGVTVRRAPSADQVNEIAWKRIQPWVNGIWNGYKAASVNEQAVAAGASMVVTLYTIKVATRGWLDTYEPGGVTFPHFPDRKTFPETEETPSDTPGEVVKNPPLDIPQEVPPFKPERVQGEETETGEGTETGTGGGEPTPEKPPFWMRHPQPRLQPQREPDGTTVQRQRSTGRYIYYYSPVIAASDFWSVGENTQWATGYYYTSLSDGQIHNKLTEGETSFSLYGHPYGQPLHGFKVEVTEAERNSLQRPDGGFDTRVSRILYRKTGIPFLPTDVITNPDGTTHFREIVPIYYTFKSGIPGAADVPRAEDKYIPKEGSNGNWVNQDGTSGTRGDCIWRSTDQRILASLYPDVATRPAHVDIPYEKGYPDFSAWYRTPQQNNQDRYSGSSYTFPFIFHRERDDDFVDANRDVAIWNKDNASPVVPPENKTWEYNSQPNVSAGEKVLELNSPRLTWHHIEDMKTMQAVITNVHKYIKHAGGSTLAEKARR